MIATATTVYYTLMPSPIGALMLTGDGSALTGVYMHPHKHGPERSDAWERDDARFAESRRQLDEYFAGARETFDLPLAPQGTEFQQRVWRALLDIPYARTASYRAIAESIGQPKAVRAVGLANGRNPISIIIPCHRIIGSDGSLTGYGGGMERKRWLLAHEQGGALPGLG